MRHRAAGTEPRRNCGNRFRHSRIPTAAPGRQRVPRVSCATNTRRCPTSRIVRCTCGWIWSGLYTDAAAAFSAGAIPAAVRAHGARGFEGFESGSIQQVIYQIGTKMLAEIPRSPRCIWKPNNRTWDTIDCGDAATNWASTPKRVRRIGCLWLALARDKMARLVHACSRYGARHPGERREDRAARIRGATRRVQPA